MQTGKYVHDELGHAFVSQVHGQERLDLFRRLNDVLALATETLKNIDISTAPWDGEIDCHLRFADKVITEASLLLLISLRTANRPSGTQAALANLSSVLISLVRSDRNRMLLRRHPVTAAAFGIGHVALNAMELFDAEFDRLVRQAFASGRVESVERLPYRAMDVRWLRSLVFSNRPPSFQDLVPHSVISKRPHPIEMSSPTEIYALTHSLMYLTDFGTNPLPKRLNDRGLAATVHSYLASSLAGQNLDLIGELLLSTTLLRTPWSPYDHCAWDLFVETFDQCGFLASPSFSAVEFAALPPSERHTYAMQHTYHTTWVAGILFAVLLTLPHDFDLTVWTPPTFGRRKRLRRLCCSSMKRLLATNHHHSYASAFPSDQYSAPNIVSKVDGQAENTPAVHSEANDNHGIGGFCGPWWNEAVVGKEVLASAVRVLSIEERELVLSDVTLISACHQDNLELLAVALRFIIASKSGFSPTFGEAAEFFLRQWGELDSVDPKLLENEYVPISTQRTAGLGEDVYLQIIKELARVL